MKHKKTLYQPDEPVREVAPSIGQGKHYALLTPNYAHGFIWKKRGQTKQTNKRELTENDMYTLIIYRLQSILIHKKM